MKAKVDIQNMTVRVYNKIANWHNEDATKEGLKLVTREVIEDVLNDSLGQLGRTYTRVEKQEDKKKKFFDIFKTKNKDE